MENIIEDMIHSAAQKEDDELASFVYKLMYEFARTANCPRNWRAIGGSMVGKYGDDDWIVENCRLYDF